MHWAFIGRTIGLLLILLGFSMAVPMGVSLFYNEAGYMLFLDAMALTLGTGLLLVWCFRIKDPDAYISQKVGMASVALAWIAVSLFGAIPFYLSPDFHLFTDAFFESVSGFTTTGSSVMTRIELASKGLLMWRSMIQWIGGMGIIVLSLAVLPFLGVGGIQLYRAEVPSPVPDKLTPRLRDSAKILWVVYLGFTLVLILLLWAGGMPLFDSINHAFTTLPTGGFSTRNASIAAYDSAYFEYVITLFMIIAGINFSLHYQMLKGRPLSLFRDGECRFFICLTAAVILLVTWDTYGSVYHSLEHAFRFASFQVASIITTTGFASADYEIFPGLSQTLLFTLMVVGASAGSTGGGVKCARVMTGIKYCHREVFKILHPRSIVQVTVNKVVISDDLLKSIMGFLGLYALVFVISSLVLAGMGVDMLTAFGAVAACLGNIGPGFGSVGPTENFVHLPLAGKWLLSWCMLAGRLEIYTIIILFAPEFWKG